MFGDADSQQLNDLAKLSNGKVFDGRNGNLSGIFREVKGLQLTLFVRGKYVKRCVKHTLSGKGGRCLPTTVR